QRPALARAAEQFSEEDLTRFFQILLQTDDDLRRKPDPRVHLEMGLLRLIHAARLAPLEELLTEVRNGAPVASGARAGGSRASTGLAPRGETSSAATAASATAKSAAATASAGAVPFRAERTPQAATAFSAPSATTSFVAPTFSAPVSAPTAPAFSKPSVEAARPAVSAPVAVEEDAQENRERETETSAGSSLAP